MPGPEPSLWRNRADPSYYEVVYFNNLNKGKATVMIKGDGANTAGSRSVNFTIKSKSMSLLELLNRGHI